MKSPEGSTVIGKSVTIHGELSGKEDLYLDGIVEGTISLPENRLTIGPNARVLADVHVHDIIIYGHLEGNIHALGKIELRESAVVKGDIIAERLSIEENATIKGKVELSEQRAPAKPTTTPIASPASSAVTPPGAETRLP